MHLKCSGAGSKLHRKGMHDEQNLSWHDGLTWSSYGGLRVCHNIKLENRNEMSQSQQR